MATVTLDFTHRAVNAATTVGGVLAGVPWWALIAIVGLYSGCDLAWRVFQRPDLAERWLDVGDRRRERKVDPER